MKNQAWRLKLYFVLMLAAVVYVGDALATGGQPNSIMPVTREQAYPIAHITTLLQQRDHLSSIDSRSSALNNNDGCMAQAMGNSGYMTHQQIVCKGNNNARGRVPL